MFSEFIALGVDRVYGGVVDEDGDLVGGSLIPPAAGNTTGSLMRRIKGVTAAPLAIAAPDVIDVPGDNGSEGSFTLPSLTAPSFQMENSVFSMFMQALQDGTLTFDDVDIQMGVLQPADYNPPDMCFVLQSPSKKKGTGVEGLKAWSGYFVPLATAVAMGRDNFATRTASVNRQQITPNVATKMFDGLAINTDDFGTEGGRVIPFTSDYPIVFQRFTGNGTEDTFVLGVTPAAANTVRVRVDGVLKVLTTDYTVDLETRELVFEAGDIPGDGAKVVVRIGQAY